MILYKALVDLLWCFSLIYVTTKTSSIFYKYTSNNVVVSDTKYWQGICFHMSKAAERIISLLKGQIYNISMSINCTWYVLILLHHYVHDLFQSNSFVIVQRLNYKMHSIQIWKDVSLEWLFNKWLFILHCVYISENGPLGWNKILKRILQMFPPFY